jgi:RNA polymerase sigma factor (sigma-70 family)
MGKAAASPIVQFIHRVVADQRLLALPDPQLLERFHDRQDQAAFQALLCRHGPMVLEVCRGVLGNEADAEDGFQATFLVLARSAGSIRKKEALTSWLHGVAYRTALKARAQSATRQKREADVPERQGPGAEDLSWQEVRQVLHAELNGLPDRYRAVLVLCYLEGATQDAAALQLGLAKSTLRERLERGRALLRARLLRRGLGPAAVLVAAAWPAGNASASVPMALLEATIQAATLLAAGQAAAAVVSARVAALTEGVLETMLQGKLTRIAIVFGLVVALAVGIGASMPWVAAHAPAEEKKATVKETWKSAGILKHEHSVLCVAFGPDEFLLVSDEGVKLRAWEVGAKKQVPFNEGRVTNPRTGLLEGIDYTKVNKDRSMAVLITYAADNSWVSFLARNGVHMAGPHQIEKDGKVRSVGPGFSGDGVRPLAIAADGETHALVGTDPKTVRMIKWEHDWDRTRSKQEEGAVCKGHDDEPLCAAFAPDNSLLVTGSADKTARIWDPTSGNEKHVLRSHTDSILVVAFSPDGKQIATGGKDGLVKLWDATTGKERASLKGHTVVRCVTFAPDGKTLVSGGEDEMVRIWDAATGREQAVLRDHKGIVLTVAFSRDGSLLASGGTDKMIRLWKKK